MAKSDDVSTDIFGANCPTSTGAPGTGPHADGGTDQLNPAGDPTTELSPGHVHSFVESSYHEVDQSGMPHGGVEAAQNHHQIVGSDTGLNDTGAGNGSAGHKNGRN